MPSPIAHGAVGYLIYRVLEPATPKEGSRPARSLPPLLIAAVGLSLLPDVDAILGVLAGDLSRFHNNWTHSFTFGFAVALVAGGVGWVRQRSGFIGWFFIALLSYELHVIMDFFTVGRGVMALWPFSLDRYESPVKLFYGLHWSDGWISMRHAWTLVTELGFVAAGLIVCILTKRKWVEKHGSTAVFSALSKTLRYVFGSAGVLLVAVFLWVIFVRVPASNLERAQTAPVASSGKVKLTAMEPTDSPPEVPKYGVFEGTLIASREYANSFTAVDLAITVEDPNGKTYTVSGFYDGDGNAGQNGRVWGFRLSPDVTGTWRWATTSSDPDLNDKSGSFAVSGTIGGVFGQGPVVVDPDSPRYFKYREGSNVFLIGKFLERNQPASSLQFSHVLLSELFTNTDRDTLVTRHKNMNLNKMNIYIANKGDYFSQSVTPWVGTASSNDKTRFDLARWKLYESWIERLWDEGIVAELWFFADDSGFGSLPQADRERLIQYAMARLSAYTNTKFVHSLEWQEGFSSQEVESDISFLRDNNPWGRLVSVHGLTGDFSFPTASWADFMATQAGFDTGDSSVNTFALAQRGLADKPHLLEELAQGYETDAERKETWASFMAGSAGVGTGSFLRPLSNFASSVPFYLMEPDNTLVSSGTGYAMADLGQEYVVYLPSGGSVAVDLSAASGTLNVEWYNPRDGSYSGQTTTTGGASRSFTPPFGGDAVLHIKTAATPTSWYDVYLPLVLKGS